MPCHHSLVDKQMQNDQPYSVQLISKQKMPVSRKLGEPVSLHLSYTCHVCWANEQWNSYVWLFSYRKRWWPYSLYHYQEDKSPCEWRSFTCKDSKYSISSISLVLAVLGEAVIQSSSAAEAQHAVNKIHCRSDKTSPESWAIHAILVLFLCNRAFHSFALCIHGRGLNPPPLHSSRLLAPHWCWNGKAAEQRNSKSFSFSWSIGTVTQLLFS